MDKIAFIILASGKSSRFGGFPKALCKIENKYIAQHTIDMAGQYFDDTYLVLNSEIYSTYESEIENCHVVSIETGLGDAHSLLRALKLIHSIDSEIKYVVVCWGDTFFFEGAIFQRARKLCDNILYNVGYAICSEDVQPYAWFDIDGNVISKSHFASEETRPDLTVHDQSVFVFEMDTIITQLDIYKDFLNINDDIEYTDEVEMKTLNAFTFFYQYGMKVMLVEIIESGLSSSFNTKEEFGNILVQWEKRRYNV